jgi:predicted nucleic-acid-binding protein
MIGLDSNILLRAIANDDPEQSPKARTFIASLSPADPGLLNSVVLAEIAWTLRVRYKRPRAEVLARLETLLRSSSYVVTGREAVNRALLRCREYDLEFSDALIGEMNIVEGARFTITFDAAASETPAFERLV